MTETTVTYNNYQIANAIWTEIMKREWSTGQGWIAILEEILDEMQPDRADNSVTRENGR